MLTKAFPSTSRISIIPISATKPVATPAISTTAIVSKFNTNPKSIINTPINLNHNFLLEYFNHINIINLFYSIFYLNLKVNFSLNTSQFRFKILGFKK